jgi:polysaccharide export outer membrane protein
MNMTLGYFRLLAVSFLAALLAACSSAGNVRSRVATLQAPDSTNTAGAYEGASDYRVGAQDLLEISVFGVDSLNKTVRVNSNGQITLPLIGGVQAGGHTIPELEQDIAAKLSKTYLQNPQVSVFVKEYTSQRITLEGALKNPGIYPITGKTTLLQSVALAGGLDPLADLGGVVVFRQVKGKKMAAVFDMRKLRSGQMADPQVYGDDMIVVEASNSKTAVRRFLEIIPGIGLFFLVL